MEIILFFLGIIIIPQLLIYLIKKLLKVISTIKLQKKLNELTPQIKSLNINTYIKKNEEVAIKKEEVFSKIDKLSRYSPLFYFHYFIDEKENISVWRIINADTYEQQKHIKRKYN